MKTFTKYRKVIESNFFREGSAVPYAEYKAALQKKVTLPSVDEPFISQDKLRKYEMMSHTIITRMVELYPSELSVLKQFFKREFKSTIAHCCVSKHFGFSNLMLNHPSGNMFNYSKLNEGLIAGALELRGKEVVFKVDYVSRINIYSTYDVKNYSFNPMLLLDFKYTEQDKKPEVKRKLN
jgi:hypothetical protein